MSSAEPEIFIDTSILVSYFLRTNPKRQQIANQLQGKNVITCSVVLYEYKRRVLKEAEYLITLFNKKQTVAEVKDHLINVLLPVHSRKQKISLNILERVLGHLPPDEQKERAISLLHIFMIRARRSIEKFIDEERNMVGCECARHWLTVIRPYEKYDLGPMKCKKVKDQCGFVDYLNSNREMISSLRVFLEAKKDGLSEEMMAVLEFLEATQTGFQTAPDFDPCNKLGDFLIALDSKDTMDMYTMNYKESRFFCEFFNQNMILSYPDPLKDDRTFSHHDLPWDFSQ